MAKGYILQVDDEWGKPYHTYELSVADPIKKYDPKEHGPKSHNEYGGFIHHTGKLLFRGRWDAPYPETWDGRKKWLHGQIAEIVKQYDPDFLIVWYSFFDQEITKGQIEHQDYPKILNRKQLSEIVKQPYMPAAGPLRFCPIRWR